MTRQIEFYAIDNEIGIDREFSICIDEEEVELTYELLLNEFNNLCAAIGVSPIEPIPAPEPTPEPTPEPIPAPEPDPVPPEPAPQA